MARTRRQPRPEGRAALAHLLRAGLAAAAAVAILRYRPDLETLGTDLQLSNDVQSRFVSIGAAIASGIAVLFLIAAVWRIARWLIARRHRRMLRDPERAASVPPLESHLTSLRRVPGPGRAAWQSFVFALVVIALVTAGALLARYRPESAGDSDDLDVGEAVVVVLFGIGLLVMGVGSLRRWLRARRVEELSEDPTLGVGTPPEPSTRRAPVIPRLEVAISAPGSPPTRSPRRIVSTAENVFGRRPWNLAYLRLFENEARVREFLDGPWRECGYVHLIRSATSVGPEELEAAEEGDPVFINSDSWLLTELAAQPAEPLPPGKHVLSTIAGGTVKVRDPYGSYPVRSLLCHSSYWKSALDVLLERMDVVVLDLSGYQRENLGTGYELQRVIDRFPISRCVLLADPLSDSDFLEAQVQEAWLRMADGSPNAGEQPREVRIAPTEGTFRGTTRALAMAVQQGLVHNPNPDSRQ
jgi:hypothetical protein